MTSVQTAQWYPSRWMSYVVYKSRNPKSVSASYTGTHQRGARYCNYP